MSDRRVATRPGQPCPPGSKALGRHEAFLLAGLVVPDGENRRSISVHAKAMLVDDAWATVGSCNLHSNSLSGHIEMNASVWDGNVVRMLRHRLLQEHLDEDTGLLNDRGSLRRHREVARANVLKRRDENSDVQGLAVALDPATYGRCPDGVRLNETTGAGFRDAAWTGPFWAHPKWTMALRR